MMPWNIHDILILTSTDLYLMAENNVHAEYIMAYEFQFIFTTEEWVGVWCLVDAAWRKG